MTCNDERRRTELLLHPRPRDYPVRGGTEVREDGREGMPTADEVMGPTPISIKACSATYRC